MTARSDRGTTLIELMIVLAINAVLVGMVVSSMIDFDRTRRIREQVSRLQGTARQGLVALEDDVRIASLGTRTGVVWSVSGGNRVSRPAVQIFDDVPGVTNDLNLEAKPGTDAVLVVRAARGEWAKATRDHHQETALDVAQNPAKGRQIEAGQPVLIGDFSDAGWDVVRAVNNNGAQLVLASPTDVFPGVQNRTLPATASVRPAQARLYYVSVRDELVRLELAVPRPPSAAADVLERRVLAAGVENMQVECEADDAGALGGCPGPIAAGGEVEVEARPAFGTSGAGQGPRFVPADVPRLRMVSVSLVVRSRDPVSSANQGDAPIAIGDAPALGAGAGTPAGAAYVRRSYRAGIAVRNTSLGVL